MTRDRASEFAKVEVHEEGSPQLALFGMGLAVYAVSFALPAVSSQGMAGTIPGWICAWMSLAFPSHIPLLASGLINPLALCYVVLRAVGRAARVRRALAIAPICLIPASWTLIAQGLRIQVGYVAWVLGLLMMLGPEALAGRRS